MSDKRKMMESDYLAKGSATYVWGMIIAACSLLYILLIMGLLGSEKQFDAYLSIIIASAVISTMILFVGIAIIQLLRDIKKEIIKTNNKESEV